MDDFSIEQKRAIAIANARLRLQPEATEPAKEESPYSAKNMVGAAVEPNLSLLSGAAAAPLSGLAGIAGTVLPGPEGQGSEWTRRVGNALSYEPRTQGGQTATEAISYPFRKMGEGANWVGEKTADITGSPAAGAAVNAGLQVGGPLAIAKALKLRGNPSVAQNQEAQLARNKELSSVLGKGRELGLTVPPSQANPSFLNRVLESIGGKAATQQEASAKNQSTVYSAGQKAANLPPQKALTEENLVSARESAAAPYREVKNLFSNGPQTPATQFLQQQATNSLEKWKNSNAQANRWYSYANQSKLPTALDKAQRYRDAAVKALDDLESIANATPNGKNLVPDLKAARVQIAKIHEVENAMRGSSFDAPALGRSLDRGSPLTGDLKTVGQFAQDFPKAVAPPQTGGSVGVNQLAPYLGAGGGGAAGAALGGLPGASLGSIAGLVASQAIPPAVRSVILSPAYQKLLANPKTSLTATQFAAKLLNDPNFLTTGASGAMVNQENQ